MFRDCLDVVLRREFPYERTPSSGFAVFLGCFDFVLRRDVPCECSRGNYGGWTWTRTANGCPRQLLEPSHRDQLLDISIMNLKEREKLQRPSSDPGITTGPALGQQQACFK